MSAQTLATALSGAFILAMVWLRTRMHYARQRRGTLRLTAAGRLYFGAAAAVLIVGWFLSPPLLGRVLGPQALANATLTRVIWFLLTYYAFILVHRSLQQRHREVFVGDAAP